MCMMVILYYQLDYVESMQLMNEPMTSQLTDQSTIKSTDPDDQSTIKSTDPADQSIQISDFKKSNCRNSQLYHKEYPIKTDMAQHIFPELNFKYEPCNPCDNNCKISFVNNKLSTESDLLKPKSSNDSFYESWKDIFGKDTHFFPKLDEITQNVSIFS